MKHVERSLEMKVLLVGEDTALLEGLAQSFAAVGYVPQVAASLHEAREVAADSPPLLAVVERDFASEESGEALAIPLAPGGALVLYHGATSELTPISPRLQRSNSCVMSPDSMAAARILARAAPRRPTRW